MDLIKKYARFEYIKQLVSVAIILGFIFGIGKGLLFVYSNRYFELGMYTIAFSYFHSIVNHFSLIFPFIFLIISLAVFFIYFVLTASLRDEIRGKKYTYYTVALIVLVGLFLIAGYRLNKLPWYPDFFSVKGFIYNAIVTLFFIFLGFVIYKILLRIHEFLSLIVPKVFHFRFALIAVFLLLVLNGVFYYSQLQKDTGGLNVLFITVDTLRADHLGAYGYVRDTSPNIDNLAKEGILFSQAIAQWPKTSPSFASMLTSTYGYYNGVRNIAQKISHYFVLLPEILRNANYSTVGIVTNGNLAKGYDFNQGFDTYIEVWQKSPLERGEHVTEYALSWLQDNSHKGKFFMWLHYIDPHSLYEPPDPYNKMYVGDEYYKGFQRAEFLPKELGNYDMGGIPNKARLGNINEIDYYVAQYDAEIRYVDANVGKVLDAIKAMGLDDNTVIIFTADHGESLSDHNYYFGHGRLPYDDCVRVPLIVKIPGLKSEVKVIDRPVELINIMPTVLDILNIPVNKEAQGRSLVPLMLGDGDGIPEYAFTESGYKLNYQRSIRTKRFKLIYIPDKEDQEIMQGMPFELYNIEDDPHELSNLINIETKIAGELHKELFKWMESAKQVDGVPSSQEQVILDKETEERLRALGYIE